MDEITLKTSIENLRQSIELLNERGCITRDGADITATMSAVLSTARDVMIALAGAEGKE